VPELRFVCLVSAQLLLCLIWHCVHLSESVALRITYVALTFWQVFEQFLLVKESRKICRTLLIYTNRVQVLMLLSFVHDTSHVKQVSDDVKDFFTSGDCAKRKVTLIQVKVMNSKYICCLSMAYCEGRVTKNSAGPCVCVAGMFDDIFLHPW